MKKSLPPKSDKSSTKLADGVEDTTLLRLSEEDVALDMDEVVMEVEEQEEPSDDDEASEESGGLTEPSLIVVAVQSVVSMKFLSVRHLDQKRLVTSLARSSDGAKQDINKQKTSGPIVMRTAVSDMRLITGHWMPDSSSPYAHSSLSSQLWRPIIPCYSARS